MLDEELRRLVAALPAALDFRLWDPEGTADSPLRQLLADLVAANPRWRWTVHRRRPPRLVPEADDAGAVDIWGPIGFTGVRYVGFPGGMEFATWIEALVVAARPPQAAAPTDLAVAVRTYAHPVHLLVFTNPG
jgi:hypothetical protein